MNASASLRLALLAAAASLLAAQDAPSRPRRKAHPRQQQDVVRQDADNTGRNVRDRDKQSEPTAGDQKDTRSDVELAAAIRGAVVKDDSLSVSAHNVKIIAQDGNVTLKGPVNSQAEKKAVEDKAAAIAGASRVRSELEIKP